MSDDIDIQYSLDPSGYLVGVNQIDAANQRAQASMAGLMTTSSGLQRAWDLVTPKRAAIAGLGLMAQQAAQTEQQLSGLSATSVITGVNQGKLAAGIRAAARDMPIGFQQARALTEQYTKMGVSGAGSERQIARLVTTSARLGGATGEGPAQLTEGLVNLSRATGNSNLDPTRFEKLSDSLTTVSAKMGASATSTLAFSKNIAPLAQNAGIGATGVLGISAAFSRLGEDGIGASTAVNKMLTDMNRAVREGGPEMKTYAQIAGMTATQFERLYKANPAEALTQVTEAISKSGNAGPRQLEMLGLDGVRTMRSLQALSASGGLRPAIATATGAYGSGSTQKASEAAFSGLNDSLGRLEESSSQLAESFGRPLLGALTVFTDALKVPTDILSKAANSGPGQAVLTGGLALGGLALSAKAISGPLGVLALGRQAATAGPGRALFAGLAAGAEMAPGSRTARYGAAMQAGYDTGRLGPINSRLYDVSRGFGERYRELNPAGAAGGGPGMLERARLNARMVGHNAFQSYTGMITQGMLNAAENDPTRRSSAMGMSKGLSQAAAYASYTQNITGEKGQVAQIRAFNEELKRTTGSTATFRQSMSGLGSMFKSQQALASQLGKDVRGGAGRLGRGLVSAIGPEMLAGGAISAGIGVLGYAANRASNQADARQQWGQGDVSGWINAYRESIGKATDTTVTFASSAEALSKNLAKTASTMSFDSVQNVTADDRAAASGSRGKITHQYSGSASEVAAQIASGHPEGLAPDELQAVKIDLLRQMSSGQVSSVMKSLPSSVDASKGQTADMTAMASQIVRGIGGGGAPGAGIMSLLGGNKMADLDTAAATPGWLRQFTTGIGGGLHRSSLTDAQTGALDVVSQGIDQRAGSQRDKYGSDYALQEQSKTMNKALKDAFDSGNADLFNELSNRFGQQLGGADMKDKIWSGNEFQSAGFDFSKMVADSSKGFAGDRQAMLDAQKAAGGQIKPEMKVQAYVGDINRDSMYLGQAFDPRTQRTNDSSKAIQASLLQPEDVAKQQGAVQALINGATKAGKSMESLALESSRAAQKVAPGGPEQNLLLQTQQRAEQAMARQQGTMTSGQAQMQQYRYVSQLASQTPTSETERQQQEQARGQAQALQSAMIDRMRQRLMVQRQADISSSRARQDFGQQAGYAREDYGITRERANRSFRIAEERSQHQYQQSVQRSEEDFYKSRNRALRDFNLSMSRGESDFLKQRGRQVRDFNIGLKRQIEDAAKTLYDPYARIQTKATYDAGNLMLNLREQTEAMSKQKSQLDALRKLGLSSQTIDTLGLGKTENAQQLNNLSADAMSDPKVIAQLNAQAKLRGKAAGALTTDSSNTDLKRQREDLAKGLKDSNEDYAKSVARAKADLARGLGDSQKDFRVSMARNAKDFSYSLAQSRKDLNISLTDMAADFGRSTTRQKKAFDISMSRMAQDVAESDMQIAGSFEDLAAATNKAIHGQAVNWQKLLKNDTKSWVKDMKTDVIPQLDAIFSGYGVSFGTKSMSRPTSGGKDNIGRYADGGPIAGTSPHPKADNILIKATAGEFMQPVHAVKHYGENTMEAIRQKRIPKEVLAGFADGGLIGFGVHLKKLGYAVSEHPMFGGVHPVHANGSQHYNKKGPGGGGAIDVNADPFNSPFKNEKVAIDKIIGLAKDYGLRTIWQSAGHFNHAHFDISKGGDMMPGGYKPSSANPGYSGGTGPSLEAALGKLKSKGGVYDQLTASFTQGLLASDLGQMLGSGGGGDAGAHGKGAKANQAIARAMLSKFGWGQSQMGPLIKLWNGESGWNERADNPSSSAYGIPQALPGSKMSSAGSDWRTNPATQIKWGLGYIKNRPDYGSPEAAWAKWQSRSPHWYDNGGFLQPGETHAMNGTGKKEAVLTDEQWGGIKRLAAKGAVSAEDFRGIGSSSGMHVSVTNAQSYHYDQRNDFSGARIVIQSEDPDSMAHKLAERSRRDRLTQTRGVRRNG